MCDLFVVGVDEVEVVYVVFVVGVEVGVDVD